MMQFNDYFGNSISVGDYVAGANNSGHFAVGRVEKLHPKTRNITLRTANSKTLIIWNQRNCAVIKPDTIPPEAYLRMQ